MGKGQHARNFEVVLKTGTNVGGGIEDEDIVGFGCSDGIVVEVVDDSTGALSRERNVNLRQKRYQ